ncbi:MAG: hydroxymethylglutaryl-CoA reductase [Gammaproteobacteria bacterium]|nr:hydroxymethylglutaryl-CoA reductase [Gammaproteobacteria bacterium]
MLDYAHIPMKIVGPIAIHGEEFSGHVSVPLATYETPVWATVARGARMTHYCENGIGAIITQDCMTRSIVLEANNIFMAQHVTQLILNEMDVIEKIAISTSRFAKLTHIHPEQIGNLIYLRLAFTTADASGHNMTTLASEHIQRWILRQHPELRYVAISGNYCTDKKVSAINGILGRGKSVIAELFVPQKICQRFLKASPTEIEHLHIKKNLLGSIAAGSLRSANAHVANMLLAFYLATGQDAANIVEGSQGIVHCEARDNSLYFSVTLPNLIVGTVGNGKNIEFVQKNLYTMGLIEKSDAGKMTRKLAIIAAATVLCGELSLLGAIANQGELVDSHMILERKKTGTK